MGGFAAFNAFVQISSSIKKWKEKRKEINQVDAIWDMIFSIVVIALLIGYFVIAILVANNIEIGYLDPIF